MARRLVGGSDGQLSTSGCTQSIPADVCRVRDDGFMINPPPAFDSPPAIESGECDEPVSSSPAPAPASWSRVGRGLTAFSAVPLALTVGCVGGVGAWWFFRVLYSPGRALGFGLTLAGMVAVSMLLRAALPAGRVRRHVLAGLPGLWVSVVGGGWLVRLDLGTLGGWLVAGLGLVVVAGIPELGVWWATHGGGIPYGLLRPAGRCWSWSRWLPGTGCGTCPRTWARPANRTRKPRWLPGSMRCTRAWAPPPTTWSGWCARPRRRGVLKMPDFQRQWTAYERRSDSYLIVEWYATRNSVHGDTATVSGTVSMRRLGHRVDHQPPAA